MSVYALICSRSIDEVMHSKHEPLPIRVMADGEIIEVTTRRHPFLSIRENQELMARMTFDEIMKGWDRP